MRLWFAILFVMLAAPVLAQECLGSYTLERERIETAQLFLTYRGNIRLIGMDAIIAAMTPLRETAELEALRDEFRFVLTQSADALTMHDSTILDDRANELDTLILSFRNELASADLQQLRQIVHDAIRKQSDRVTALRNQAFFARKQYFLKEFDRSLCIYRTILIGMEESHGTKRLLDRLRRVEYLRPKLEAAIDDVHRECRDTPVFQCGRDSVEDLEALQHVIVESLQTIKEELRDQPMIDEQRQSLTLLRADIEILSEQIDARWDIPPQDIAEDREEILKHLANAEERFREEKYDLVDDLIEDLKRDYEALQEKVRRTA